MFATGMYCINIPFKCHSLEMSKFIHLNLRPYRKTQNLFGMKCQRLTGETRGAKNFN